MTDATADKSAKTDDTTPTLVDQLDDPRAGNHGTPVHARCISCEQVRVKAHSHEQSKLTTYGGWTGITGKAGSDMNLNLSKPITINVWDVVFLPVCVGGFAMFYFLGSGVERVEDVDRALEAASELDDDPRVREHLNRARSIRSTIRHGIEDDDRDDDQEGLTDIDADQLAREIEDLDDVDEWGSSE